MGFWSDFFGGGTKTTKTKSAGRGSGEGKTASQTGKSIINSITSDIKMGLSTLGQDKEAQAQTLRDQGYSERAIQSFQDRTAASQAAMAAMTSSGGGDSSPAPAPTPPAEEAPAETVPTEPVVAPPPAPPPVGQTPSSFTPGPAETKVIEDAAKKTGWSGTVKTTSRGLETEAKTRKRRSLMGAAMETDRLIR